MTANSQNEEQHAKQYLISYELECATADIRKIVTAELGKNNFQNNVVCANHDEDYTLPKYTAYTFMEQGTAKDVLAKFKKLISKIGKEHNIKNLEVKNIVVALVTREEMSLYSKGIK